MAQELDSGGGDGKVTVAKADMTFVILPIRYRIAASRTRILESRQGFVRVIPHA